MAEVEHMRALIDRTCKLDDAVATVTTGGKKLFTFYFSAGGCHWTDAIIGGLTDTEVNLEVRFWVCFPNVLFLTRADAARSASRLL
jgi:hypothetical protein